MGQSWSVSYLLAPKEDTVYGTEDPEAFQHSFVCNQHDTMIDPKHFTGTPSHCEQCLKVGQTEKDKFYVVSYNMDTWYYVESKIWYK